MEDLGVGRRALREHDAVDSVDLLALGDQLALMHTATYSPDGDMMATHGWDHVAFVLTCDDADTRCARMSSAEFTIVADPSDSPFGRTFAFVDPDGYRVVMHDG